MMAKTHIMTGFAYGVALYPAMARGDYTMDQYALVFAGLLIGSLLPDIDHPHSLISQAIPLVGGVISKVTKHRGLFHSVLGVVMMFFILGFSAGSIAQIAQTQIPFYFATGAIIGYVLHILGDIITIAGVRLFYPFKVRIAIPVIRTNGYRELAVQIGLVVFVVMQLLSFIVL